GLPADVPPQGSGRHAQRPAGVGGHAGNLRHAGSWRRGDLVTSIFARKRHPETLVYVVLVLWLIGYPGRAIAFATGLRPKQVEGIVQGSEYGNRAGMSDPERAEKLAELAKIRFDDNGQPLDA